MAATEGSYDDPTPRGRVTSTQIRSRRSAWLPRRTDYTSETKPFYLTSEFLVFVLYLMGLGIAAGSSPSIDARLFWILATAVSIGYMLARGIATGISSVAMYAGPHGETGAPTVRDHHRARARALDCEKRASRGGVCPRLADA